MKIEYKKHAVKYLKKLDKNYQLLIIRGIEKIPEGDIIPLQGRISEYRLRIGKYRVVFEYSNDKSMITILDIDSRGDIYK